MPMPRPPFDLDLLRSFVTIVDAGGFTRAAERLGCTQSTISLQIKRLEDGLGRAVLARGQDGRRGTLVLTPDGEILLAHAREILRLCNDVRLRIMAPEIDGTVRLGTPEDFATWHLPDILARFARAYPLVRLEVNCDFTVNLLAGFASGSYDLVLVKREPEPGRSVWREALVWVAGTAFRPDESNGPLPLVLAPPPDLYRKRALAALDAAGLSWRVVYTSPSLAGLQAAVRAGLGVTVLPQDMVDADLRRLDDLALPILPDTEIVLYRAPGQVSPAVDRLEEHIRQSLSTSQTRRDSPVRRRVPD